MHDTSRALKSHNASTNTTVTDWPVDGHKVQSLKTFILPNTVMPSPSTEEDDHGR